MNPADILFDLETGDLAVQGGDLVIGESTQQHQYDVIVADKGHYKASPELGVGATNYLLDQASMPGLAKSVRKELERDGQAVDTVTVRPDGQIQIQATYPARL